MFNKVAPSRPWMFWLCGFAGALLIGMPVIVGGNSLGAFFNTFIVEGLAGLTMLLIAAFQIRKRTFAVLSMLLIFIMATWAVQKYAYSFHTTLRWSYRSSKYKRQVLIQAAPGSGGLKHVEWEGWGGLGTGDTTVYLVFSPDDALADATHRDPAGRVRGVPCEVYKVQRFERQWYAVQFYTDTDWDHCS